MIPNVLTISRPPSSRIPFLKPLETDSIEISHQVTAPGYKPLVTQIFDRRDKYLQSDAVFAVKESLIVDFVPRHHDPKAEFELDYDFLLAPLADPAASSNGVCNGTH